MTEHSLYSDEEVARLVYFRDSLRVKQLKYILILGILWISTCLCTVAQASFYDRRTTSGMLLFDSLLEGGVPRAPLDLVFRMFDYNVGRIPNVNYAVVVDYSLPSVEKRLYLMDLNQGTVSRYYVAHGVRSGVVETRNFSNLQDSWKSSLGFYYAKGSYNSPKNGLSLYLDGIDRSNNNAKFRQIVLHGARYVSDDFIRKNGRLGWSEGCFAVSLDVAPNLISILQMGSILLSYHSQLMSSARQYPWEQSLLGEEVIPRGVNRNRTPGEGGGADYMMF